MIVPSKSTGAADGELNWQGFSWNIIFYLKQCLTTYDYADMDIWQTFSQEWTYHFESEAIIWKEIKSLYGVNDKLWALKRKLDVLENLYQSPRQVPNIPKTFKTLLVRLVVILTSVIFKNIM